MNPQEMTFEDLRNESDLLHNIILLINQDRYQELLDQYGITENDVWWYITRNNVVNSEIDFRLSNTTDQGEEFKPCPYVSPNPDRKIFIFLVVLFFILMITRR